MKMRKILAAALALALAVSVFAGCSKGGDTSSKAPTTTTSGSSVSGGSEGTTLPELPNNTLSITVARPQFNEPAEGAEVQKMWDEMMPEYLGCTLDITWEETLWNDYLTNQPTQMASGTFADVVPFGTTTKDLPNQYGPDQMLVDLSQYKDLFVNYQKFIDGTTGGEEAIYNEDGSVYAFYSGSVNENNIQGAQSFTAFAYRFDLLQENDLTPATTLDEYTELCRKLKELYPDAYPISNSTKDYAFYRGFVGIFHTWDTLYWNGSEWVYGPTEDSFREMLIYLNGLYKEGLIDPEFVTDTSDQVKAKAVTGKILTVPTLWAGSVADWNKAIKEGGDTKTSWGLAYLPSKDGEMVSWKWGSKMPGYSLTKNFGIMINADTEYPEWIIKMIDYQYSDEMIDMMNWGVEGETYEVKEDGTKDFTEAVYNEEDPDLYMGKYGSTALAYRRCGINFAPDVFEPLAYLMDKDPWWDESDGYTTGQYWIMSDKYGGEDSVAPADRAPYYTLSSDESQTRASAVTAYETITKEWGANFISGVKDPNNDADWQAYLDTLASSGVDMEGTIEVLNEKCQ